MHERATFAGAVEFLHATLAETHSTIDCCMNRPVLSYVCIPPWTIPIALLPDEHFSSTNLLSAKALYATTLRDAVSAVLGGTPCFLMSHG